MSNNVKTAVLSVVSVVFLISTIGLGVFSYNLNNSLNEEKDKKNSLQKDLDKKTQEYNEQKTDTEDLVNLVKSYNLLLDNAMANGTITEGDLLNSMDGIDYNQLDTIKKRLEAKYGSFSSDKKTDNLNNQIDQEFNNLNNEINQEFDNLNNQIDQEFNSLESEISNM